MFSKWLRIFGGKAPIAKIRTDGILTVSFDASRVSETVKANLRRNILLLEDIEERHFDQVYEAALRSIAAGRDLRVLCNALMRMNIAGMTKGRASEIAHVLNNKATALMTQGRQEAFGITQAVWLYSGSFNDFAQQDLLNEPFPAFSKVGVEVFRRPPPRVSREIRDAVKALQAHSKSANALRDGLCDPRLIDITVLG